MFWNQLEIILQKQDEVFWNKRNCNILDKELAFSHDKRKSPQASPEMWWMPIKLVFDSEWF